MQVEELEMTQAAYAKHRGFTRQYVTKLKKQGKIIFTDDGKVDVAATDFQLKKGADPAREMANGHAEENEPPVNGRKNDLSYHKARTVREGYQAKMAELEYKQKIGELVQKKDVQRLAFNLFRELRDKIYSLPSKVSGKLVTYKNEREVVAELEEQFNKTFAEFSDELEARIGQDAG